MKAPKRSHRGHRLGPPVVPFSPLFCVGGFPKIDKTEKQHRVPTCFNLKLLEDLVLVVLQAPTKRGSTILRTPRLTPPVQRVLGFANRSPRGAPRGAPRLQVPGLGPRRLGAAGHRALRVGGDPNSAPAGYRLGGFELLATPEKTGIPEGADVAWFACWCCCF